MDREPENQVMKEWMEGREDENNDSNAGSVVLDYVEYQVTAVPTVVVLEQCVSVRCVPRSPQGSTLGLQVVYSSSRSCCFVIMVT